MATGYGGWIAGDDWRAVVEATVANASNGTQCTVTVTGKLQNVYAISGSTSWNGLVSNSASGTSSTSFSGFGQNTTVTIKTNTFTVSRTHAAQTITVKCAVTSPSNSAYGTQTSTATVTLTIPARASYTVAYNANGGSGAPASQTKWHGEALALSTTKPTRTGYTFGGSSGKWHATGGDTGWYDPGDSYTANASATLYAAWTIITYTVAYNANGGSGSMSSSSKDYGGSLTVKSNAFTYAGRTFTGWNTKADGSGTSYAAGSTYSANASATLYAQWKLNTYTVSYNANGGSGAPASQTKTYGKALTLSSTKPTKSGHTFAGWNTKSDGSGTTYKAGASYTANAAATLYAQWTVITYAVKYAANGGSSTPASQTKTHGEDLPLRPAISRTSASTTYTVTFDANGGTVSPTSRTATKTTSYSFYRWKSTAGTLYAASGSYDVDAATTMTAQWTSSTSTGSVALPTPTRANYSFVGWYTAATGGTKVTSPYTPTANVTLHAHWSLAYTAPKFTKLTAVRCRQDGTAYDEGEYCAITATWTDGSVAISDVTFEVGGTSYSGTISGTEATALAGTLSTEQRYTVTATITDGTTTLRKTTVLTPAYFTLDFFRGGRGVAIGMAAAAEGFFVKLLSRFYDSVRIVSSTLDRGGSVSSDTYGNSIYLDDANGKGIGYFGPYQYEDGETGVRVIAFNEDSNGAATYNTLRLGRKPDGTYTYAMSGPSAFRDATGLGALATKDAIAASEVGSGTLALARGGTASDNTARAINTVFAGPSSGSAGNASWRGLVAADIPNLNASKITAGTFSVGDFNVAVEAPNVYSKHYVRCGNGTSSYAQLSADASHFYINEDFEGTERAQWRFYKSSGDIQFRLYADGAWGSWARPFFSSLADRTANTVLAAPNGSAGVASFRKLVAADLPTVTVAKGGTGQTGVTTITTVASFISAASGVTIASLRATVWGKVVHVYFTAKPSAAKTAAWTVGTVVAAYRPNAICAGGVYYTGVEHCRMGTDGVVTITAAPAQVIPVSFTYLID